MITIFKTDIIKNTEEGQILYGELRGVSTATKPTTINGMKIGNGSVFIETDTQKIYFFDEENQEWLGE
jgi:hypothetical protein